MLHFVFFLISFTTTQFEIPLFSMSSAHFVWAGLVFFCVCSWRANIIS